MAARPSVIHCFRFSVIAGMVRDRRRPQNSVVLRRTLLVKQRGPTRAKRPPTSRKTEAAKNSRLQFQIDSLLHHLWLTGL
jgi:hypothetical protein